MDEKDKWDFKIEYIDRENITDCLSGGKIKKCPKDYKNYKQFCKCKSRKIYDKKSEKCQKCQYREICKKHHKYYVDHNGIKLTIEVPPQEV